MINDRNKLALVVGVAITAIIGSGALLYVSQQSKAGGSATVAPGAPVIAIPGPPAAAAPMNGKPSLSMSDAANRLALRLSTQDGSADDWALLARSYVELRQYPDAVRAFDEALKKAPNDVQLRKDAETARQAAKRP
jgi:cytochrome c-type biogenesis protein CcmH/NrfG